MKLRLIYASDLQRTAFWLQMGDPSIDVTEENQDAAQILKSKAMEAISEGTLLVCCDLCILLLYCAVYRRRKNQIVLALQASLMKQ